MEYEIKPITAYQHYKAAEQLQAEVLGFEPLDVIPYQILQSFATSGGAVIGAYDAGQLIGVVMGYTGLLQNRIPYHRSQRMAVLRRYRSQGVGAALKHAQAALARSNGLQLMCWTFDPLRSLNAHLNLHKLGATSRRYIENAYAVSTSPRDRGAALDRLWVEWDLTSPASAGRETASAETSRALWIEDGRPSQPDLHSEATSVTIQIPPEIDEIREQSLEDYASWRMATRAVFNHYLARGYTVADYERKRGYVLTRSEPHLGQADREYP